MTGEEAEKILLISKMTCGYPHGAYGVAVDVAVDAIEQVIKMKNVNLEGCYTKEQLYWQDLHDAKTILLDVRAYLASRAGLENESLAGHSFVEICDAIKIITSNDDVNNK